MYLAWKELWYNKSKFSLIIALVVLITYLVFFLTSLAYGLASLYSNGINKIESDNIVLSTNSNNNAMMSNLSDTDLDLVITDGTKEKLSLFPAVLSSKDIEASFDSRVEVFVFGVSNINFFIPDDKDLTTLPDNKVIVDKSLEEQGYKIGDFLVMEGTNINWEIIGFTNKATYQTAPIVYSNLKTLNMYRYNGAVNNEAFNAIVTKGKTTISNDKLSLYKTQDYIATLPGYTPQVLTFSMMIIFLIIIIAFVLGIFIYVLTIQKVSMFGVMKAQGISNRYISTSVLSQTAIIVLFGGALGFILTQISGVFLKGTVPFAANYLFYGVISLSFFIFALLGGMFSVRAVVKIDPLEAIG